MISPPMHLNSLLNGLLGVFFVHKVSGNLLKGHFLNLILNLRQQLTLKFGETLLLVGTKRMDEWELCPKFEEPIGALPQI